MMKAYDKIFALILSAFLLLSGCETVKWDTRRSPQSPEESETEPAETLPARKDAGEEPSIEGGRTLLQPEPSVAGEPVSLRDAFQAGDTLVLIWSGPNGDALEPMDPDTGVSVYQIPIRGSAYRVEPVPDSDGEYRVVTANDTEYRSARSKETSEIVPLPGAVLNGMWRGYPSGAGAPWDRGKDGPAAYAATDGIYLTDGAGENPRILLDNASIPDWLGYWGLEGQYDPSKLHYVAPLLMNGGDQVAATAYYADDAGGVCLGVVSVEAESGNATYFPVPVAEGEAPARRVNADLLHAKGESGDILITPSTGEAELIPYDDPAAERRSFDFLTFARLETTEFDGGSLEHILVVHPFGLPEEGGRLLTLGGYARAEIAAMTEDYVLVEAEDGEGEISYLAVNYTNR